MLIMTGLYYNMKNKKNTLLVIASYEHPEFLETMFQKESAFWNIGEEVDILLVNNGSISKEYYSMLKKYSNKIIIEYKENFGRELSAFSFAEKKYENYDRYMFLQHDVKFIKPNWLSIFKNKFNTTKNCGAVGFRVYSTRSNPDDYIHFPTGITGHECDDMLKTLIGNEARLDKFCAGSILYTSRGVLNHLRKYGGIQFVNILENTPNFYGSPEFSRLFTTERLFSSMIENLGYKIVEASNVLINGFVGRGRS